jgi:hypothetical protein
VQSANCVCVVQVPHKSWGAGLPKKALVWRAPGANTTPLISAAHLPLHHVVSLPTATLRTTLPDPRFHLSAWTIDQVTAGHKLLHPSALDGGTSNMQASLPGGERHAAVGTEYLQSVATMVRFRQLPSRQWPPLLLQLIHQRSAGSLLGTLRTVTTTNGRVVH